MNKTLLLLGAAACLTGSAAAQQTLPQSADLSLVAQQPAVSHAAPAVGARATSVCDDFNRANSTNLGPDWNEMVGDVQVLNNLCSNVVTTSWMLHTGASASHVGAKVEFDIDPNPGAGYANTAAIIGYNPANGEAIYVKVQNQSGQPGYSHVGFYHAINQGAYTGGTGWGAFQALPYQTPGGHVTVSVDAAGDLVTLEIDEDHDGIPEISMVAPGSLITSGLGALLGDQYGLGFWTAGNADNFEVNDGCGPVGPSLALLGSCPGSVGVDIGGMTAGGNVAIVAGVAGAFNVPAGRPCAGTAIGVNPLAIPQGPIYFVVPADANGEVNIGAVGTAGPAACGLVSVVAIDLASCAVSNVAAL